MRPRCLSPIPGGKRVGTNELSPTQLIELAGDRGLLDPALARKTRGMAGIRDAIVHLCGLDYRVIHEAVRQRLGDLDEFARQVKRYVDSEDCAGEPQPDAPTGARQARAGE